jgi:recombination protein RecT
MTKKNESATTELTKEMSIGERFANKVLSEMATIAGSPEEISPYKKTLVRHLFLSVNAALEEAEKRRAERNNQGKAPYVWANVNMPKLAQKSLHIVNLGLDACIPNHVSPVFFWDEVTKSYAPQLTIGYVGKDYCMREMSIDPPVNIVYELLYSTDRFVPHKKDMSHPVETYEFDITTPLDRGSVVGGFGYIEYETPALNKIEIVTLKDFEAAKTRSIKLAGAASFWHTQETSMQYKTIVSITTKRIRLDPHKINDSFYALEQQEEEVIQQDINSKANSVEVDLNGFEQKPVVTTTTTISDSPSFSDEKPNF